MKNKFLKLLMVGMFLISIHGCGSGNGDNSGGDKNNSTSPEVHRGDIININQTPSIKNMGLNTLATKMKYLEVEHISISKIGDIKTNYTLEKGDIMADELTQIGEADANLDNNATPIDIENATFYHVKTTFKTIGTYPEGVNFTIALVSTDKNNPFTSSIHNQNVIIEQEGEQNFEGDILIPTNIPAGKYLLVISLSNEDLGTLMGQNKKITDIPQIGATYVYITTHAVNRTTALLDINTTKYMDTPYHLNNKILFIENFLQHESGKGRFLFSNIGIKDVNVSLSATLELANGDHIDLGLLDPSDKNIKKEIILTIPHASNATANQILKDKYNIVPTIPHYALNKKAPIITPTRPDLYMVHHHVFIPFAGKGVIGEQRYRVTLGYYLPKESYEKIIQFSPDLSKKIDSKALQGSVKWRITFLDRQTVEELSKSISMTKFRDTVKDYSIVKNIQIIKNPILDIFPKPIEAALDMLDGTAYVFSGIECAKLNTKTGKVIGEWHKTSEVFTGGGFFFNNEITAAFRMGDIAYFFLSNKQKYFSYNLKTQTVIESGDNRDFKLQQGTNESVATCMDNYLQSNSIDATFRGDEGFTFISGNKFMHFAMSSTKFFRFECVEGGSLGDKEQWASINNKPITAVLSNHDDRKGTLRFFINGFGSKVILNKPNLFLDQHNGLTQTLGDSDVISLNFDTHYGLEGHWFVPNARAYANAHLNFYLFGYQQSLIKLEADAYSGMNKIHPLVDTNQMTIKSGAKLSLYVLGSKYFDEGEITEIAVTAKFNSPNAHKTDHNSFNKVIYGGNIKKWEEKVTIVDARFPVGPVMLQVTGGINGSIHIDAPIDIDTQELSAMLSVKPNVSVDVGVFADGGVNYELVKAGVESNVKLTEVSAGGMLGAVLKYQNNNINFSLNTKANAGLNLLRAEFSFYAGTRTHIDWCSSWGIPYPCGLGWDTWDIPIYNTPWLYQNNIEFFNKKLFEENIPLD